MKTFTVTYHHTHNYGALLQAYALQHTIELLGHSNLVLEYPYSKEKRTKIVARSPKETARNLFLRYLNAIRRNENQRRDTYFVDFHKNHLKLSREYSSMEDLVNNPPDADCLLSGSDQVWNLNTLPEFIPARFLAFGDEKARRISYAASIEGLNYSASQKEMVREYLTRFNAISLREQSAKDYIEGFTSIHAERVLDPVFLLTPDEWRTIAKQPRITGNYILCYQVQRNPRMQEVVDNLKKKTGYYTVSVCNSSIKWIKSDHTLYDVSPEEFIGLYDGASIVVSASFHGTALGILFGKPTYGLVKKTRGNRIRELLNLFGLESFCISGDSTIPDPNYDYREVVEVLQNEREKSLTFLKENIENE